MYLRTGGEWVALYVADDPRTSVLEVLEDNRVHRMGDSGVFTQRTEEIANGARFVWTSPTLRIVQSFHLTRGFDSSGIDAVEMRVSATNEGERASILGVRLVYDTYLGESSNVHFVTPAVDRITGETALEPGAANRYVASVAERDARYGFQVMLDDPAVTRPQAVVLANWRRLTDTTWDYEVNPSRNFNRLPYSINDSALMIAFEPLQLRSGERYSVTMRLGNLAPNGYLDPDIALQIGSRDALRSRLAELIGRIDALIEGAEIDSAEIDALREEIRTLSGLVRGR